MHYPACGILLDGPGAEIIGAAAAKALGCVEIDLRHRDRHETVLERINRACVRHDWPAVPSCPESRALQVTDQWVESPGVRSAVMSLNPYAALSLATNPGFHLIHSPESAAPLGILSRVATKVIPVHLHDLCVRKLSFDLATGVRILRHLPDRHFPPREQRQDACESWLPKAACHLALHLGSSALLQGEPDRAMSARNYDAATP